MAYGHGGSGSTSSYPPYFYGSPVANPMQSYRQSGGGTMPYTTGYDSSGRLTNSQSAYGSPVSGYSSSVTSSPMANPVASAHGGGKFPWELERGAMGGVIGVSGYHGAPTAGQLDRQEKQNAIERAKQIQWAKYGKPLSGGFMSKAFGQNWIRKATALAAGALVGGAAFSALSGAGAGTTLAGAGAGAATGATGAAVMGSNVLKGALIGGVTGGVGGAARNLAASTVGSQYTPIVSGVARGATGAALNRGNITQGALMGGAGGVGNFAGGYVGNLTGYPVLGGATSGLISSALTRRDLLQGGIYGAAGGIRLGDIANVSGSPLGQVNSQQALIAQQLAREEEERRLRLLLAANQQQYMGH